MPPKVSPEKGKKGSPKDSPDKKKTSPDKKGKKNSPDKGDDGGAGEEAVITLPVRPRPPKTPPPPVGPPDAYILRQHWYTYANEPTATLKEWYWTPQFPLATSWGDIIISDPPRRRLCRYVINRMNGKLTKCPDIIIRGEPYNLAEMPKSGRILAVIRCPTIFKTRIGVINALTGEMEHKIDYPYEPLELEDPPVTAVNECGTFGVTTADDLIFVLRNPIQKIDVYDARSFAKVDKTDIRLQNMDSYDPSCMHLAPSGGCAAGNNYLYVAARRPPRVVMFEVKKEMCYDLIDKVTIRFLMNVGSKRMESPYGLAMDGLGMLAVTDSMWNFIRIYRYDGNETCHLGSWKEKDLRLTRPTHLSISRHGVLAVVEAHSNSVKVFIDKQIFNWYDGSIFYIDRVPEPSAKRVTNFAWPKFPPPVVDYGLSDALALLKQVEETTAQIELLNQEAEAAANALNEKQNNPKDEKGKKSSPTNKKESPKKGKGK